MEVLAAEEGEEAVREAEEWAAQIKREAAGQPPDKYFDVEALER